MTVEGTHVVFGTGPVGMAVMDELRSRGRAVRMVNRSGRAEVPDDVELVAGDATDSAFTTEACKDAAVVYSCVNPPYEKWPQMFPPLQAGVVEGAATAGAKLVAMENVYMYGPTGGKLITEDLPYSATTRKGMTRARMAQELLRAHESGKVRVAIGRASDFFGPRVLNSAMGDRVFPAALAGKSAQAVGNPDLPHTYTYVPDIGRALVVLGEEDQALGRAWHLPNPETVTTRQFIEMIFAEAGHPARLQVAPKLLLRALGLFNSQVKEVVEMLYEFEEPFVVDSARFEQTFDTHATSLADAIKTTVAWFRQSQSLAQTG